MKIRSGFVSNSSSSSFVVFTKLSKEELVKDIIENIEKITLPEDISSEKLKECVSTMFKDAGRGRGYTLAGFFKCYYEGSYYGGRCTPSEKLQFEKRGIKVETHYSLDDSSEYYYYCIEKEIEVPEGIVHWFSCLGTKYIQDAICAIENENRIWSARNRVAEHKYLYNETENRNEYDVVREVVDKECIKNKKQIITKLSEYLKNNGWHIYFFEASDNEGGVWSFIEHYVDIYFGKTKAIVVRSDQH